MGLVEENARLRAELAQLRRTNQDLLDEVSRLTAVSRHPPGPSTCEGLLDDAEQRFALLELDL